MIQNSKVQIQRKLKNLYKMHITTTNIYISLIKLTNYCFKVLSVSGEIENITFKMDIQYSVKNIIDKLEKMNILMKSLYDRITSQVENLLFTNNNTWDTEEIVIQNIVKKLIPSFFEIWKKYYAPGQKFIQRGNISIATGIIKCPNCKSGMVIHYSKTKAGYKKSYICSNYRKFGACICEPNTIDAGVAEEFIINECINLVCSDGKLNQLITNDINTARNDITRNLEIEIENINQSLLNRRNDLDIETMVKFYLHYVRKKYELNCSKYFSYSLPVILKCLLTSGLIIQKEKNTLLRSILFHFANPSIDINHLTCKILLKNKACK